MPLHTGSRVALQEAAISVPCVQNSTSTVLWFILNGLFSQIYVVSCTWQGSFTSMYFQVMLHVCLLMPSDKGASSAGSPPICPFLFHEHQEQLLQPQDCPFAPSSMTKVLSSVLLCSGATASPQQGRPSWIFLLHSRRHRKLG